MYHVPQPGWTTQAIVTNVVDGDTVDIEVRRTMRVRLLDCYAPETRTRDEREKARGLAAKQHLTDLIGGKEVILHVPTSHGGELSELLTLGRVLGRLFDSEGMDVSKAMCIAGHARDTKD